MNSYTATGMVYLCFLVVMAVETRIGQFEGMCSDVLANYAITGDPGWFLSYLRHFTSYKDDNGDK